jgi:hypothetical protein
VIRHTDNALAVTFGGIGHVTQAALCIYIFLSSINLCTRGPDYFVQQNRLLITGLFSIAQFSLSTYSGNIESLFADGRIKVWDTQDCYIILFDTTIDSQRPNHPYK